MINGIYWDSKAPAFFNIDEMATDKFNSLKVILNAASWGYDWDYAYDWDRERDIYLPPSLPLPARSSMAISIPLPKAKRRFPSPSRLIPPLAPMRFSTIASP